MPPIERNAYSDPLILEGEIGSLFSERMFAGTQFDFEDEGGYRSVEIGHTAVTVRRAGDGVRGFGNVCLHRNCLIDPPGYGKRAFRCRYHGWAYASDGTLAEAPLADDACIQTRTLPTYPVAESSGLNFLGLSGRSPEISEVADALKEAGITLERPFYRDALSHACNWKLLVENVLEGYHLSFVHGQTFRPAGFTSAGAYTWGGGNYTSWNLLKPAPSHDKQSAMRRLSPGAGHYYRHVYVFPDLFLSNTNGLVGFLSHVVPTSASTTRLEWLLFELPALKLLPIALRTQIKAEAIRFTLDALKEDQVLVESCHTGMTCGGTIVQLQPCEGRIAHFHALYTDRMRHV